MTDKAKLESLLTALRAAKKGSRELDAQIEIVCFGGDQTCPNAQSWTFYLVERRSSSLDAAAAFRKRMLPGWWHDSGKDDEAVYGRVYRVYLDAYLDLVERCATECLSIVAAVVAGVIAKEKTDE
jgi:hypothetical protein